MTEGQIRLRNICRTAYKPKRFMTAITAHGVHHITGGQSVSVDPKENAVKIHLNCPLPYPLTGNVRTFATTVWQYSSWKYCVLNPSSGRLSRNSTLRSQRCVTQRTRTGQRTLLTKTQSKDSQHFQTILFIRAYYLGELNTDERLSVGLKAETAKQSNTVLFDQLDWWKTTVQ